MPLAAVFAQPVDEEVRPKLQEAGAGAKDELVVTAVTGALSARGAVDLATWGMGIATDLAGLGATGDLLLWALVKVAALGGMELLGAPKIRIREYPDGAPR